MECANHPAVQTLGHLVPPHHLPTVKPGPIPSGLLCFGVEAVFRNFAKKLEDHKTLHCLSCSSSVRSSLLGKKRKLKTKNLPVCVKVCAQDAVFLRTHLQMQAWELFLGTLSPHSAV